MCCRRGLFSFPSPFLFLLQSLCQASSFWSLPAFILADPCCITLKSCTWMYWSLLCVCARACVFVHLLTNEHCIVVLCCFWLFRYTHTHTHTHTHTLSLSLSHSLSLSLSQLIFAALEGHTHCSNDNYAQVIRQIINFTCDTDIQQSSVILQTYVDCSMQILRCGWDEHPGSFRFHQNTMRRHMDSRSA